MKNSIITLAFVMYLSALAAGPKIQPIPDSNYCVEINGLISNSEIEKNTCKVELLCENVIIDSAFLKNGKKKFSFFLEKEKYYTIRISLKGHVTKTIAIDTKNALVPASDDEDDLPYYAFETNLEKESDNFNQDLKDRPYAILYYDQKKQRFDYNKEYTETVKKEMFLTAK